LEYGEVFCCGWFDFDSLVRYIIRQRFGSSHFVVVSSARMVVVIYKDLFKIDLCLRGFFFMMICIRKGNALVASEILAGDHRFLGDPSLVSYPALLRGEP
jgi:hypothetical protein